MIRFSHFICYEKNIALSSIASTKKNFHIHSDLNLIYKQNFYHEKQKEMDERFDEYHIPLLIDLYHPAFIEEWKKLDSAAYEKN